MKISEMPEKAIKSLKDAGIAPESISYVCHTDITFSGEFDEGYLVIADDYLVKITADINENILKIFGGVPEDRHLIMPQITEYSIEKWSVAEFERFSVENMVSTNMLRASGKTGTVRIAVCTNTYLGEFTTLKKLLNSDSEKRMDILAGLGEDEKDEEELYCPQCHTKYPDPDRKVCPVCMNKKSVFARALKYFLKYRGLAVLVVICYIITSLLEIVWPYLSGTVLYDYVLGKNDDFLEKYGAAGEYIIALIILVVLMAGIKFIQMLTQIVQQVVTARLVTSSVRDMKKDVFSSVENLSMSFYTGKQTGTLMTRVLRDAERVTEFFIDGFPRIFTSSITIIASFVIMFSLNWQMSVIACVLLPLLVFISVKLKPALWTLFGRRHRAESAVNSKVNDNLTGARVVRAFGQQSREIDNFESPNDYLRDAEVRIVKYNNRFNLLYEMVQVISSMWVWALGVFLVLGTGSISMGILITFVGYVNQLNGPMKFFSWVFRMWSDSINASQRMFEIMDSIPEVTEKENPIHLPNPEGTIDIENMTFGYDVNHPVLKNINLHVKAGEMLGIVGKSGAGKTTLVNLLSRLYDVNEGKVCIDGINVKDLAFEDLRKNVAMVSQDTYLFMGSIADNIAYADENVSREKIIEAAKLAGAHEFISAMPDGYDTQVGGSGVSLSGGEKQRISIARAIIADPKILILDEATASVDTATEKLIQNSLNILVKGRTTLSIAHRLSTLRDANRIIVIDGGRIVEEGTRDELDELGGIYHNLMELQNKSLQIKGLA